MLPHQISVCTIHRKTLKKKKKLKKKSSATWSENFDLPHRSYSVSDIRNYFESIKKNHETATNNPPISF